MVDSHNLTLIHCQSSTDFQNYVLKSKEPVILKFGAEWCPPCKEMEKSLTEQIKTSNGWKVVAIDVDNEGEGIAELVTQHKVEPIPAVFLYDQGKQLDTFVGFNQKKLAGFIQKCGELMSASKTKSTQQASEDFKKLIECQNKSDFDKYVLKAEKPVILKFGAEWCPPCREMEKVLQQKVQESKGWSVVTINVDNEGDGISEIVQNHKVEPIPAVFLYHKGKQLQTFIGFNQAKLNSFIQECDKLLSQ